MPAATGGGLAHQDWNTVIVRKKPTEPQGSTIAKAKGGGNAAAAQKLRKLDANEDGGVHALVSLDLKLRIQKARQAKGMTQKQLGQAINEKPGVINTYEQGKAIPNNAVLGKIEKALGVKLRGKQISTSKRAARAA
eukprot:SAG31_NODE_14227_length_819_cov_1.705556_1_plen_136_part_00